HQERGAAADSGAVPRRKSARECGGAEPRPARRRRAAQHLRGHHERDAQDPGRSHRPHGSGEGPLEITNYPMRTVGIVGVWLIGASFGLALREAGFTGTILGVSSARSIDEGLGRGAIDRGATLEEAAIVAAFSATPDLRS